MGDGTTANRPTPVQVSGLSGVTAIAAGYSHTVASKGDGTVWAWGWNEYGQLGDGTTTFETHTPVQVSGLSGVKAIAAGVQHTVALKGDSTVWAWGSNFYGQLGGGTTASGYTPVQVSGLSGVTAIAAGERHNVALKGDGTVWDWGDNYEGQLGDDTTASSYTPVQVSGLSGVTAIAAVGAHTVALKVDGTVWAWGDNYNGQLGDGTTANRPTPVQVSGLSGITAIVAGYVHTVALKGDGTAWAWGWNGSGQLGNGTTASSYTPVQVSGLSGVTSIAAGGAHTVALKGDGTVWAWGGNDSGQLGINPGWTPVQSLINLGTTQQFTVTPVAKKGGSISPATPQIVSGGTTVSFTVTPETGYSIKSVTGCSGSLSDNIYTTGPITADCRVKATFKHTKYELSFLEAGTGSGKVRISGGKHCRHNCNASFPYGIVVNLTPMPDRHSTFEGWSGCDAVSGIVCAVIMNSDKTVTATFNVKSFRHMWEYQRYNEPATKGLSY